MSDVQPNAENNEPKAPPSQPAGTNPVRLTILLLVFGIALAGLLYDYCVARPGHKNAYDKIMSLLDGTTDDPNGDGTFSDDEVQSVLGYKPSKIESLPNGKIEIYSWRSGLPYRTYDLFIVYAGQKMPLLMFASTERPAPTDLPKQTEFAKEPTQEELDNFVPQNPGPPQSMPGSGTKGPAAQQHAREPAASPKTDQDAAKQPADKKAPKDDPAKTEPAKEEAKTEPAKEEAKTEPPAKEASGGQ